MAEKEDVYCTLVMNDAYLPGAAVLAHSLRDASTKKKLACLITSDGLRASTITELQSLYNYVIPIERIGNPNPANLYLMNRPDLLYTFTKINLWRLTQFRKIVYIDSDVVALRAPEELFDLPDDFAAAPDVGWPDIFNTGVMVLTPNNGDYNALRGLAQAGDSFDGADQGLLNQYFEYRPWKRLSFTYNTTPSANYQYEPAYRYFKRNISIVHFIGSDKPWQKGRAEKSMGGAFQELLSRWWAVWDRHYEVSTLDYIYGQKHPAPVDTHSVPPQPSYVAEPVLTEPSNRAEDIIQGHVEPAPTIEQRRFSAPQMEWDATRGAPPVDAKPEAVNFPTQTYEFNKTADLFRPPPSYPDPPKDMWYPVPEKPKQPEVLKPIFPWEEHEDRRPTRKFIDDDKPSEPPAPELQPSFVDELEVTTEPLTPATPTIKLNDEDPWQSFGRSRNAWDDMSGINDYVRKLTSFQKNRGKVQVLHHTNVPANDAVLSPTTELDPAELVDQVKQRRESLILTDFPTAIERPSLPVTPAPRRRPSFWGEERDEGDELPPAEGVPHQADWDPEQQLEQLRRNSLLELKLPLHHQARQTLPQRAMPESAQPIPEEAAYEQRFPSSTETDTQADTAINTAVNTEGKASAPTPTALDEVEAKRQLEIASPMS